MKWAPDDTARSYCSRGKSYGSALNQLYNP